MPNPRERQCAIPQPAVLSMSPWGHRQVLKRGLNDSRILTVLIELKRLACSGDKDSCEPTTGLMVEVCVTQRAGLLAWLGRRGRPLIAALDAVGTGRGQSYDCSD